MKISLEQAGKKFYRHWIFKSIDYTFTAPESYALLGSNGSGKSTLMRLLAGMQSASSGKIRHEYNGQTVEDGKLFPLISFCAPGMEIIEEMTLREFLNFHFSHKRPLLPLEEIIALTGMGKAADKMISEYSSGMKQRVKLAQAIFAATPLLLLDEPCTNLDEAGVAQYRSWMDQYTANRLVIVASNDVREYFFCKERLEMSDWK
ncbi:MAG TPA: ATP-binding cassette domain-containing protein [Flavipsychrobacter sp.]|nr:ATP-binding cassette domain-containing protein [Flavipsychrobacter sp.]